MVIIGEHMISSSIGILLLYYWVSMEISSTLVLNCQVKLDGNGKISILNSVFKEAYGHWCSGIEAFILYLPQGFQTFEGPRSKTRLLVYIALEI